MQAILGVITCDKCGKPMTRGQKILVIAEGAIARENETNEEIDFHGSGVRYACHFCCWDGVEDPVEAETKT